MQARVLDRYNRNLNGNSTSVSPDPVATPASAAAHLARAVVAPTTTCRSGGGCGNLRRRLGAAAMIVSLPTSYAFGLVGNVATGGGSVACRAASSHMARFSRSANVHRSSASGRSRRASCVAASAPGAAALPRMFSDRQNMHSDLGAYPWASLPRRSGNERDSSAAPLWARTPLSSRGHAAHHSGRVGSRGALFSTTSDVPPPAASAVEGSSSGPPQATKSNKGASGGKGGKGGGGGKGGKGGGKMKGGAVAEDTPVAELRAVSRVGSVGGRL